MEELKEQLKTKMKLLYGKNLIFVSRHYLGVETDNKTIYLLNNDGLVGIEFKKVTAYSYDFIVATDMNDVVHVINGDYKLKTPIQCSVSCKPCNSVLFISTYTHKQYLVTKDKIRLISTYNKYIDIHYLGENEYQLERIDKSNGYVRSELRKFDRVNDSLQFIGLNECDINSYVNKGMTWGNK